MVFTDARRDAAAIISRHALPNAPTKHIQSNGMTAWLFRIAGKNP
jgi:hypothetical protein